MSETPYINGSLYQTYRFNPKKPFYLTIPKADFDEYELFISFPDEGEANPAKIKEMNDILIRTHKNAIHLICNIKRSDINEFSEYNDNKVALYQRLQNKLFRILASTYDYLKKQNKKIKIPITAIKQNDGDTKLINWLEIEAPRLIKSVDFKKIRRAYNENIFSGTMAIPFINHSPARSNKQKRKVRLWKGKGFANMSLIITIFSSSCAGIIIANILMKLVSNIIK